MRPRPLGLPVRHFQFGIIYLQVFIPEGEADALGYELAQTFSQAFSGWRNEEPRIYFEGVEFSSAQYDNEPFTVTVKILYKSEH